jgi:pyruvate,water dikinase
MATPEPLLPRFAEIGRGDVALAGGKGASLGELLRAGIRVPPGFVVSTAAFEAFMGTADPHGALRQEVGAVDPADLKQLNGVCVRAREQVRQHPLPDALQSEIGQAYAELAGDDPALPVAVRSSATSEDSAEASFAGLQDTFLWVRGMDDLLRFIRRCWASLYNAESVGYRRERDLPEKGLGMAVVVQQMVNSAASGVMFSRSPTTGDRSVVAIEGSWGLGSSIVSGEVTPDKFIVNKVTGEIVDRAIADKGVEHLPDPGGRGVVECEVPEERRNTPCLDDEQVRELVGLAKRIERHYGCDQDMEWAVQGEGPDRGRIFLLQSRPETVWSQRETGPVMQPKDKAIDHVLGILGGGHRK